jgi:hypothetical protein
MYQDTDSGTGRADPAPRGAESGGPPGQAVDRLSALVIHHLANRPGAAEDRLRPRCETPRSTQHASLIWVRLLRNCSRNAGRPWHPFPCQWRIRGLSMIGRRRHCVTRRRRGWNGPVSKWFGRDGAMPEPSGAEPPDVPDRPRDGRPAPDRGAVRSPRKPPSAPGGESAGSPGPDSPRPVKRSTARVQNSATYRGHRRRRGSRRQSNRPRCRAPGPNLPTNIPEPVRRTLRQPGGRPGMPLRRRGAPGVSSRPSTPRAARAAPAPAASPSPPAPR